MRAWLRNCLKQEVGVVSVVAATLLAGVVALMILHGVEPMELIPSIPEVELPHVHMDGDIHSHATPRSGKWETLRRRYAAAHPECAVCGSRVDLQIHHVKSFRFHPERELDETNLIGLCGPGHSNHHLIIGHAGNYAGENPHCREDAALLKTRYDESRRIASEGKE